MNSGASWIDAVHDRAGVQPDGPRTALGTTGGEGVEACGVRWGHRASFGSTSWMVVRHRASCRQGEVTRTVELSPTAR